MTAQRVGSYEIVRVLARGGMAVVYLARQPALDREVALKQLDLEREDPTLAERFVREARLAAALDHPNVVTLFDFFEHGGVPYIAMEHVAGGSLRPLVRRLDLPQVIGVLEGVLAGLGHAEAHAIAHRDLKPENVLITRGGTVKIADFGIARAYNALTGQLTSTGTSIGTPAYMAPEQALDDRLGPYTDLYAVGVIAYELLAGRPPFEPGGPPMAVLYCHVHKQPPPLAELAPGVPAAVREWVEWLLAKDPAQRPSSAGRAWEALEEIAVDELGPYWRRTAAIATPVPQREAVTTVVPVEEEEPTVALVPASRRRRAVAVVVAGVTAVAGTVAAVALIGGQSETPRAGAVVRAAAPYDFDGDGRRSLVIGMAGSAGTGVVVTREQGETGLIRPDEAGLRGPFSDDDVFGASPASADFDRDGHADLAIGAPGRNTVAVVYGSPSGLNEERSATFARGDMADLPRLAGQYGIKLLAADLNADGYGDLAVGAPGDLKVPGTGAVQILYGDRSGLAAERSRVIHSPDRSLAGFGSRMRAGDLDGDGRIDIVEGSRDASGTVGHISYCLGTSTGPRTCELLARTGTSSLAVGDVNGDGFGDIAQGDAIHASGGVVRLWTGSGRGPSGRMDPITQDFPGVPDVSEEGDEFGKAVDAGQLDGDRYADIVVGAPGEDDDAGAVMVIRGRQGGLAQRGHSRFGRGEIGVAGDPAPGQRFGSNLGLLRLPGDDRLDLAVIAEGMERLVDAVYLIQGRGVIFSPDETEARRLLWLDDDVSEPELDGIRVGRGGDS